MKDALDRYSVRSVGMAWFTPESWRQLCMVADDELAGSFDDFVRKATGKVRELEAEGFSVEKVLVDVSDMVAWCESKGYRVDAKARAEYGAMVLCMRGGS